MGKITVKHFINRDLKPIGGLYPLYVLVIYNRKIYKFKSFSCVFEYVNNEILEILNEKKLLDLEIDNIERTIIELEKQGTERITSKNIYQYAKPLKNIMQDNFSKLIKKTAPNAPAFFLSSQFTEMQEVLDFLDVGFFDDIKFSEKIKIIALVYENLRNIFIDNGKEILGIDFIQGSKYFDDIRREILFYNSEFIDKFYTKTEEVLKYFRELVEV